MPHYRVFHIPSGRCFYTGDSDFARACRKHDWSLDDCEILSIDLVNSDNNRIMPVEFVSDPVKAKAFSLSHTVAEVSS